MSDSWLLHQRGRVNDSVFTYYPRLHRVRGFVAEHLSEPLSLGDAAKVACLERKYFSQYFRRKVGIGFRQWLARVRVECAIRLMVEHDHSIRELAYKVGFADVRTFERMVKRRAGRTPRDLKNLLKPT
jgi:two-component system response regulator YesN